MTSPDYISSISLLPTVDFLEYIAKKQWGSEASYGVGLSTITPLFYSSTNSEWLCLNSESEFLESSLGTKSIKTPFGYTRPESSPVLVSFNDLSIPSNKIAKAKSLFLFRIGDNGNEVISVSNYDKNSDNTTTAPPLDCFSRECLSWFNTSIDWYIGIGSDTLESLDVDGNIAIVSKSEDILNSLITSSSKVPTEVSNKPSSDSPYVSVVFGTGIVYQGEAINSLFLYSVDEDDSLVAFAEQFKGQTSIDFAFLDIEISFQSNQIIII